MFQEMLFKDISYLELLQPLLLLHLMEQNHLSNFGRVHNEEQFCETFWIWISGSGGYAI